MILHPEGPTLKNCALTAAIFRQPAQKALFRRLDLGNSLPTSSASFGIEVISELFAHAHLAGFVRELTIYLDTPAAQDDVLREAIFAALTNVRKCTIAGDLRMRRWTNADRGYIKTLLEWLSACDGHLELILKDIDGIPPTALHALLATPKAAVSLTGISLDFMRMQTPAINADLAQKFPLANRLDTLTVYGVSDIFMSRILERPEFAPALGTLRSLTLSHFGGPGQRVRPTSIAALATIASQTLRYLHIDSLRK
ncbi:hypothetical protein MKEN_00475000 [Mycena kentingensis (nom. inval.)]|nr:hypothetical protein MKEN_00475000 [Mycena kentingensis (nom. inval.)]